MSHVLRLAIVDPNDATREALKATLLGLDTIWLEAECSRYAFFKDVVAQTNPDIAFVAMDGDSSKAVELVEELTKAHPNAFVLVSSSSTDGTLILRTMRAGAKEFLPQPIKPEDLAAALQRVSKLRFGEGTGQNRGCKMIAVAGVTGGVGSTSLAVNLGCALATDEKNSVVLLDLDLALGDADVFLDTIPEYTLTDVAQNITRLDFTLLKRSLTKHSSGLYLLPRPVHLDDSQLVTPDDLQRVIGLLKATFTHLIIDMSKAFGPLDLLAMSIADEVLVVTQLDLPCLRNVVRLMTAFEQRGNLKEKIKIIVNRVGHDTGQISIRKAQETLGQEVFWQIPNDFRTMIEVRNNGVPLIQQSPKATITHSINQLAAALCGKQQGSSADDAFSKSSWFKLWPTRPAVAKAESKG